MMSIVLNGVLILLLVGSLIYGFILNKHFRALTQNQSLFKQYVNELSLNLKQVEKSLKQLKEAASIIGPDLQKSIKNAHALKDDLIYITESADKIAGQLEESLKNSRSKVQKDVKSEKASEESKAYAALNNMR